MNKTLKIFDFDGTLYNSPTPNPELHSNHIFKKLNDAPKKGGFGWWQNPITLNTDITPKDHFIESTLFEVGNSINNPNDITVLLTGRTENYLPEIKRILSYHDLEFDFYGLKPLNGESTFKFKARYISEILANNPDINKIELWDDRVKQIDQFVKLFTQLNINFIIHQVSVPDNHLSHDIELNIVNNLMLTHGKESIESSPLYYGVFLDKHSHNTLVKEFADTIPENWKLYANHMTMLFGNNKNTVVQDYLNSHLLNHVTLIITHVGVSNDAIAVRIASDVPTDNVIPHITIAVRNGAKPVASNYITNWKSIDKSVTLSGMIDAFYP